MQTKDAAPAPTADPARAALASFIPRFQADLLRDRGGLPGQATRVDGHAALLIVDIAGFTAMTERLAAFGPRGAEQMSGLLNRHYGALVDLIYSFGGDVIAFAGDAVLALWSADTEAGLGSVTHAGARCALEIQARVAERNASAEQPLAVRAALGAGVLARFELGGESGRWHWLVAGPTIGEAALADSVAESGQVVLAPAAAGLLEGAVTSPLPDGARLLQRLAGGAPPLWDAAQQGTGGTTAADHRPHPETVGGLLHAFVPDVVQQRLEAGQSDFLAEFRNVSAVFVGIDTSGSLDELQDAVRTAQQVAERFDGTLYQCLSDDKGFVVVIVFGMPPRGHEEDAQRALLAALSISEWSAGSTSIGVASGRVFCGAYGGGVRQQYSLVGPTMNLAARLMQAAAGRVLCDAATAESAGAQVALTPLEALVVKGRDQPVSVYTPTGRKAAPDAPRQREMFGRAAELTRLLDHVGSLVRDAAGADTVAPAVIEAEAGMGKSTLVAALVESARERGIRVVVGHADAIETHTAYYPFREVLAQLLEGADDEDARLGEVVAGSGLEPYLPLIDALRPGRPLGKNDLIDGLSAAARADRTNQLMLRVFRESSRDGPILFVLEDAHWLDSASWVLVQQAGSLLADCAIVVTTRPLDTRKPELQSLLSRPGAQHLTLDSLDDPSLERLVGACLGVETLPEAFRKLICDRAGGNPFHAQELAYSLRDAGVVTVEDGRLRVTAPEGLDGSALPATLQGVITSRVDALPPQQQLTLKVASVIGRTFEMDTLAAVHPQAGTEAELARSVRALIRADLVTEEPGLLDSDAFRFRHAVIQDSVYGLLSYSQRQSLHRAAAVYLETAYGGNRGGVLPRLAHHYGEGEMPTEAMVASRDAGAQAVDTFANREAVRFLLNALEFETQSEQKLTRLEKTTLQSQLTNAYYGLTDYEHTLEHSRDAVRAAGYPPPRGGWGIPRELGIMMLQNLRERRLGRREGELAPVLREERLMAMGTLGTSMSALLFLGRSAEYLETALKLHNLAAGLEPSPESAACRSALGLCFAMLGWKRRAERELRRALAESEAVAVQPENLSQSNSLLGMFLNMQGELPEARVRFARACELLETSAEVGMWHHRAKMNYSTVLASQGLLDEAADAFAETAALTWEAEPQVFGLIIALQGLALLRNGRQVEAEPLLEEAVRRSRDHDGALPLFASLGALAELELHRGDLERAISVAFEAEATARKSREVNAYQQGASGHTGICMVFCELLARPDAYARGSALSHRRVRRLARTCSRRFRAFARKFVCLEPHYLALEGLRRYHLGRRQQARRIWALAHRKATEIGLPHEERLLSYFLRCAETGEKIQAWGGTRMRPVT